MQHHQTPPDTADQPEPFPLDLRSLPACLNYSRTSLFEPVGLVARVTGLLDLEVHGDQIHQRLRLRDFSGQELVTSPVPQGQLTERAFKALQHGVIVVVYGRLETEPKPRRSRSAARPHFRVYGIETVPGPSYLLAPTPQEVARVDGLFDRLTAVPGGLRQHLTSELNAITRTSPAGMSCRMADAQLMIILQALSHGMVAPTVNDRISMCAFGSPGVGKKKLVEQAQAAAIVSGMAQPGTTSVAGLTATVQQKAGQGWTSTPGKLPQACYGVFIHEDLHRLSLKDMRQTQGIYMAVAEDGRLTPTKAASQDYSCNTALLLNANRQSILEATKDLSDPQARANDIVIPFDLFSRLDGMIDLSSGDDAVLSAEDMIIRPEGPRPGFFAGVKDPRTAELKLLLARILDRIPTVSLAEVELEARQLMRDLALVTREYTSEVTGPQQETFNADSLLRRMANSARKFIGASARLNGRSVATVEDVECAWRMLSYKLEVLKFLCGQAERIRPLGSRERQVKKALKMKDRRWSAIIEGYGGCTDVTAEEIADALGYSVKTIQQELRSRGILPKTGRYTIPTWEQYDKWVQEHGEQDPMKAAVELREGEDEEPDADIDDEDEDEEEPIKDCLPQVSEKAEPFVEAVNEVARDEDRASEQRTITNLICNIAFKENGGMPNYQMAVSGLFYTVLGMYEKSDPDQQRRLPLGTFDAVVKPLLSPVWAERSKQMMSLYLASDLPSIESRLRGMLEENGSAIPPEVREVAEAVIARLSRWTANNIAEMQAEQAADMHRQL